MHALKVLVSCLMVGVVAAPVLAQNDPKPPAGEGRPGGRPGGQGGPGGQGMRQALSPEKAKAAWELEAKGVAASLGLSEEKSAAVVKAYVDARTSQSAAFEKMRDETRDKGNGGEPGAGGPAMREEIETINSAERAKLEKSLAGTLSADQTKQAIASLGTFNRGWDHMVSTIAGFNLEAKKQADALKAVHEFVGAQTKARELGADGDRDAVRTAMQAARDKMNTSLKGILSEDQMKQFEATTGRGQRPGRGGPAGDDAPPAPPTKPGKPAGGGK
jgi:hypothetical protein